MTKRTVPAMLLLAFSGAASAAAFQLWEQNASGIATAYAGSAAVADNASTIFFNPAGMTLLPGIQVSAGVAGVAPSYKFSNGGSSGLLGAGGAALVVLMARHGSTAEEPGRQVAEELHGSTVEPGARATTR